MTDTGHKKFSPSNSKVWINCPGYLNLCSGLASEPDSGQSIIGTAAHDLAKDFLLLPKEVRDSGRSLRDLFKDKVYEYPGPDGVGIMKVPAGFVADSVQGYVNRCMGFMNRADSFGIEAELKGSAIHEDLGGTTDFWAIMPLEELVVGDYKNGKVRVDPTTPQLKIYAILVLGDNPFMVETVRLFIYQPNCFEESDAYKEVVMTVAELHQWRNEVLIPSIEAALAPDAPCIPGDHCSDGWCRFGPKKDNNCPAILDTMFGPIRSERVPEDIFVNAQAEAGKDLSAYTGDELNRLLKFGELHKKMIATWEAEAYSRHIAGSPDAPSDFKIVEGVGKRRFKSDEDGEPLPLVHSHLNKFLPTEVMYTRKLKGLGELGKALKALNYDSDEIFKDITEKGSPKILVPATDKRKAWTPSKAEDMFGPLNGFELP